MARKNRIVIPGCVYHIVTRGNNKQAIFHDDQDCLIYLRYLQEYIETYKLKIYLYVLMTNHIHLLLKVLSEEGSSLSSFMQVLNSRYTKYFNRKNNRAGHLFKNRYYSKLLIEDAHLLELTRYIHLNPYRAGLVQNLQDYSYSSYSYYVSDTEEENKDNIIKKEEIMNFFGNRKEIQKKRYKKFVEDGIALWELRVKHKSMLLNQVTSIKTDTRYKVSL